MIDLHTIIEGFNTDEKQKFINYLDQKNKRKDIKNIQLFKILSTGEIDTYAICKQLYNTQNKGAYYALRKRLFQSLIDFTANQRLEDDNSIDMQIIKYILASRTYLLLKSYKIAYKLLDKAESLAQEHSLFPILNEIYHTKIQYAYTNPSIDIEELVSKQKDNQKLHYVEDQLNIVYAKIRKTVNEINYEGKVINFESILNTTLSAHNIEFNESFSFKSFYQLLTIISFSALVTKNYASIESLVLNTYEKLKTNKDKDKQLFYHIHIMYIIANTLFRNKKFKASLDYLNEMEVLMLKKNKAYYKEFNLKLNLLKSLNLNYLNQQENAILVAESSIQKNHPDIESVLDLKLSLVLFYFQKDDLTNVKRILSKFNHTDKWYINKAGIEWVIKKSIAEILLHIELKNENLLASRLTSFKRNYSTYLKKINQNRVLRFINLVEKLYKNPEIQITLKFKNEIEESFEWIGPKQEDIFVMSIYAWLKGKIEQKSSYDIILQLIEKSRIVK